MLYRASAPRGGHRRDRPEPALIPQIHKRGTSVAGLLYYLFGPGKREEHRNPHIVAAWRAAGDLTALQPPTAPDGKHSLKQLIDLLEQPVRAGIRPPKLTVWHCSVRNHATDRILTDRQWQHIAGEVVAAAGLAPHNDPHSVRWVAVRHANDHIHIVATLVREDGGTAWAWHDRNAVQAAARDLEIRYGLYQVGPVDHTAHRRPTAAEQNKTRRQGRTTVPRDRLRREVRAAAAGARNEPDFFYRLRTAGLLVRHRFSTLNPNQTTGYAVGLPDHNTAAGDTIWYSGGRLAPDLTLPRLRHRWHTTTTDAPSTRAPSQPSARTRATTYRRAAHAVHMATSDIGRYASTRPATAESVAYAASDLLTAAARAAEGRRGGPLTDAAELYDRASRPAHRRLPTSPPRSRQLRAVSRLIAVMGRLSSDEDTAAALQLITQVAMLAANLAELHSARQRRHQATAARQVAQKLRTLADSPFIGSGAIQPTLPLDGGWKPPTRAEPRRRHP